MTYQELVAQVRELTDRMDAAKIHDHLPIQVNIEGEAEGAFYIELNAGRIVVEPYEYYDREVLVSAQATQILDILRGKMDPVRAMQDGQIRVEGNAGRIGLLSEIIKKTPAKATAAKKEEAPKAEAAPAKVEEAPKADEAPTEIEAIPAPSAAEVEEEAKEVVKEEEEALSEIEAEVEKEAAEAPKAVASAVKPVKKAANKAAGKKKGTTKTKSGKKKK